MKDLKSQLATEGLDLAEGYDVEGITELSAEAIAAVSGGNDDPPPSDKKDGPTFTLTFSLAM